LHTGAVRYLGTVRVKQAIWGIALGMAAWSSVPALADPGTCSEPEPKLDYQRLRVVYRMELDLSGCSWYDGGPIGMSATLARSDGITPDEEAQAEAVCAALSPTPAPQADVRSGTCSVEVELDHPPVEEANYAGEITFPGPDGERSVSFQTACHSIGVMGGCD
jgi:hypothetical protein